MISISIIIATYNSAETLERCLQSIVSQKNERVELIIIDGDSKDGTQEIVNKYKPDIDYFLSEKDDGLYDAWNKGINTAKGNWIQFIGSDDMLLPDAISSYLDFIDNNNLENIDYISARGELVDINGQLLRYSGEAYSWKIFRNYMNVLHGSSLHSKYLFKEVGLYDLQYNICADYELLLRKGENLRTLYFNKPILRMQVGGMSYSVKGLRETFGMKKRHKTSSNLSNYYHFFKGLLVLKVKKSIWKMI
ncbi:MAG: glycosyltransferase family 2 protein [Dysgonomonas sp.]